MIRQSLLGLLFLLVFAPAKAQAKPDSPDTYTENLLVLGKVWGLLKYYHPVVTASGINWDEELKKEIAVFRQPLTVQERNDSLLNWILRLGKIPACDTCGNTKPGKGEREPDFSWFQRYGIQTPLATKLKEVSHSAVPLRSQYMKFLTDGDMAFPQFQNEARIPALNFPDSAYGLVALFRFWNAIEYWYPYKHLTGEPWDAVLLRFIPRMRQLNSRTEYLFCLEELAASLHDGHGYVYPGQYENIHGKYLLPFTVSYIGKRWVITSLLGDSLTAGSDIRAGDVLERINNIPMDQLQKTLQRYCGAATGPAQQVRMAGLITRMKEKEGSLQLNRSGKKVQTSIRTMLPSPVRPPDLFPRWFAHQRDSSFYFIKPGILYINVGVMNRKDSLLFFEMMQKASSVVVDMRQNQDEQKGTGAGDLLCRQLVPEQTKFVKLLCVVPDQPGAFRFTAPTDLGIEGKGLFKGPVAVLMNEQVTSVGEIITQALKTSPKVRLFGTASSGTDGNMTYLALPGNVMMSFTGLGTYFPDGTATQRVGIKPDVQVIPTLQAYRQGRDELLEKALAWLKTKR